MKTRQSLSYIIVAGAMAFALWGVLGAQLRAAEKSTRDFSFDPALTQRSDSLAALADSVYPTDPERSLTLLRQCAEMERAVLGAGHPYYANTLGKITVVLLNAGDMAGAIPVARECASIRRDCFGMNSPEYALALVNLAYALYNSQSRDDVKESVGLRRDLIDIYRALDDTIRVSNQYVFIAYASNLLAQTSKTADETERHLHEGLDALARSGQSTDHKPVHAKLLENLGMVHVKRNLMAGSDTLAPETKLANEQKAMECFHHGLDVGLDSVFLVSSHMRLGQIFSELRRFSEAVANFKEVVAYQRCHLDEHQANLAVTLFNLGSTYFYDKQHYGDAEAALTEALDIALALKRDDKSDLIVIRNQLSLLYVAMGDFDRAKEFCRQAMHDAAGQYGEKSLEYASGLRSMAAVFKDFGLIDDALDYQRRAVEIVRELMPGSEANLVGELAQDMIENRHPGWEAVYDRWLQLSEPLESANPARFIDVLIAGAKGYANGGRYDKSLQLMNQARGLYRTAALSDKDCLGEIYAQTAHVYSSMYKFDRAMACTDSVIGDPAFGNSRIMAHGVRAIIYTHQRRFAEAAGETRRVLELRSEMLGNPMSVYNLDDMENLALDYVFMRDYARADSIRRLRLTIIENTLGKNSGQYLSAQVVAESTPEFGNAYRQRDRQLELLDFVRENSGENSFAYANELINAAEVFERIGLYSQALAFATEGVEKLDAIMGEQSEVYLGALLSLSSYYLDMGQYEQAREVARKSLQMSEKYHPEGYQRINNAISRIIMAYDAELDYGSGLHESLKAQGYIKEKFGDTSTEYISLLQGMATMNYALGDYDAAIRLGKESLRLLESSESYDKEANKIIILNGLMLSTFANGDNSTVDYARDLSGLRDHMTARERFMFDHNLSHIAFASGQSRDKVLSYSDNVMAALPNVEIGSVEASRINMRQGVIRALSGRREEGLALMGRAQAMRDSIYGGEGKYVLMGLRDLMAVSDSLGDQTGRDRYALRYSEGARRYVLKSFLTLPARGRQALWGQYSGFLLEGFPSYAAATPTAEMVSASYDNLLLGKGLMLNTEREIADILAESSDPAVQQAYRDYLLDRRVLDQVRGGEAGQFAVDADSLAREVERREFELLGHCGGFTGPLSVTWQDVRRSLRPGQAAVEFAAYTGADGAGRYAALVLRPDSESPVLVELPQGGLTDLWKRSPQGLSQALWQPLAQALGADTGEVFFSAAGDIHSLPVETLPDWERPGSLVSDRWGMCRLSSTRELALAPAPAPLTSAAVYGGLRYDTDPAVIEADSRRYAPAAGAPRSRDAGFDPAAVAANDTTLRAGASYLPGTLEEACAIAGGLRGRSVDTRVYTDTLGTEASFKALSGSGRALVHVATHGFSWTARQAGRMRNLGFLRFDDDAPALAEDAALSRCGLLFAGANNALLGRELAEGVDDGVLSAREIASLDFRGLGLLVLSACETGLGEVTGEGVFGLQRGFKKAGAGAMMMSLWKVDDQATRLLMTSFYEHLLGGASPRRALALAQRRVREYVPAGEADPGDPAADIAAVTDDADVADAAGASLTSLTAAQRRRQQRQAADDPVTQDAHPYAHPRFWSGFILLDAID